MICIRWTGCKPYLAAGTKMMSEAFVKDGTDLAIADDPGRNDLLQ
jgi:hypothetical protein